MKLESIRNLLLEMYLKEVSFMDTSSSDVRENLSMVISTFRRALINFPDSDGHNVVRLNGTELHYTGKPENMSDMTLFVHDPHTHHYSQHYILKGNHGVKGGITRNLTSMLEQNRVVLSSGDHSNDAIRYHKGLHGRLKDSVEFSKLNKVTNQVSKLDDIKDAYDGDSRTVIMMRKK